MMRQFRRPMRSVSSAMLIFGTALFVALFANVAFFSNFMTIYGWSAQSLPFAGSLFLFITSIFVLVLSAVCHRATVKPLLIAFLLLSSVLAYFSNTYGTIFDYRMIANVLETNSAEAGDLLNTKLVLYVVVLGLVPSVLISAVPMARPHWIPETMTRLKLAGSAAATLGVLQLTLGAHYATLVRDHSDVLARVTPTYALYSTIKLAIRSSPHSVSTAYTVVGPDAKIPPEDSHRELVIMVVGETARADHWSLNGYQHETNPLLARESVINFPNFWSCGTATSLSVPCMFSDLGRAHFDPDKARSQDNVLDVLKRANVSILWRDNNSDSKHVADRLNYENFRTSDTNPVCDEVECRDEGMLAGLQDYIDSQKGDILIVLHQMGNHGPAYYKRYPKAFERFTPVCKTNDLGACSPEEIANAYDNAILYTDYVLAKVIELLKKNDTFETAMFYVADHGESLGEYGVYLHGLPYALAPDAQKHVPAVLWISDGMKHDLHLDAMNTRRLERWSHDNVFATLLGLFEIQSDSYDAKQDLLVHATETAAVH